MCQARLPPMLKGLAFVASTQQRRTPRRTESGRRWYAHHQPRGPTTQHRRGCHAERYGRYHYQNPWCFLLSWLEYCCLLFAYFHFPLLSFSPEGSGCAGHTLNAQIVMLYFIRLVWILQGGSECFFCFFLYYYYRHFGAVFLSPFCFFSHFSYYILAEQFGKYKPYFTKKAKKSHNSCKPLCSIELRRAGLPPSP